METSTSVKNIFLFLREIKKINEKIIRSVSSYDKAIWISDNFNKEGFKFYSDSDLFDKWITIKKQTIDPAPELPTILIQFSDPLNDIQNPLVPPKCSEALKKYPDLFKKWETWFNSWSNWSVKNSERYKTQLLYEKIFSIDQILRKQSDILELVIGHGLLSWKIDGEQILHPIFVTKLTVEFDAARAIFVLKPADGETKIEFEMLDNIPIPNRDKIQEVKQKILEEGRDPRAFANIESDIKEIINIISPRGGSINPNFTSGDIISVNNPNPVIYNAPILLLRRFDSRLWIREINGIIQSIETEYQIPKSIESLIEKNPIPQDPDTALYWKSVGEDLLFPLQANEEQKEIARRLANNFGVVVQGPPGTGKSHTIANLICHLLANGKRVLVTSQQDKALKVLVEKIPEEIRPLCITMAGSDSGSLQELEHSIRRITDKLSSDSSKIKDEIEDLSADLDKIRRQLAEQTTKLRESASVEANYRFEYEGEWYSLPEISKFLRENEHRVFLIEDSIPLHEKCPLFQEEYEHLLELLGNEKENQEIVKFHDLILKIPSQESILTKITQYFQCLELLKSKDLNSVKLWEVDEGKEPDIDAAIEIIDKAIGEISKIQRPWLLNLIEPCAKNQIFRNHISTIKKDLESALFVFEEKWDIIQLLEIQIPDPIIDEKSYERFCRDLKPWYESLKEKGSIGLYLKLTNKKSAYILEKSRINGTEIDTFEKAELLRHYVDHLYFRFRVENQWKKFANEYAADPIDLKKFEDRDELTKNIAYLDTILFWKEQYIDKIEIPLIPLHPDKEIDYYTLKGLKQFREDLENIALLNRYTLLKNDVEKFISLLGDNQDLFSLLNISYNKDDILGFEKQDIVVVKKHLEHIYGSFQKILQSKKELLEFLTLKEKLEKICPIFVHSLEVDPNKDVLIKNYPNLQLSWKWNIFHQIFAQTHLVRTEEIEEELGILKQKESHAIQNLVANRTWYNRIEQTTGYQKSSLMAWLKAIKKIGKGTGKLAPRWRKVAQNEMENCKGAIPVWIMPLHRIIENISLNKDSIFDVIIFDESSQSDIFALCALFRANKAVIVGDDQQISPYAIGTEVEKIVDLNNLFLKGIPHSELFDLKTSLYDYGQLIFPSQLMLKEHFRCVPDIIQFSNDLCYHGEIVPLRFPKKEEIFEPAIVAKRVSDGYRDELKKINKPEAEAIVEEISTCCSDNQYKGMTIGVISLLGEDQALLIQDLLRKKIGDQEYFTRKIVCGDAYAFQGDERDLIFLSLVVAPNTRIGPLTKEDDKRRFNVAASRARNRMWLFYSVDLSDLNPNCMRYRLLSYCIDPGRVKKDLKEVEHLFESGFEKDVFKLIESQGYTISPQVHVGKYRIDLVVEGLKKRLAIECDGDSWHGIDQWDRDWERQQQLERVGWEFCRIRASEFYRDPEIAIQPVLKKIEELGIEKSMSMTKNSAFIKF